MMQRSTKFFLFPLVCCCLCRDSFVAAADLPEVAGRFVQECVRITPGEGRFPSKLEAEVQLSGGEVRVRVLKPSGPFRICRFETTQELYEAVTGTNPSRWKGSRNSVEMMTPQEAERFCRVLTEHLHRLDLIDDSEVVRLPTADEWEYCCRAGTTAAYSFLTDGNSDSAELLSQYAWFTGNAAGNDPPVGALKPNAWGLYDVHGYLWELTADTVHSDGAVAASLVPVAGFSVSEGKSVQAVVCGGSWRDPADDVSSSSRRLFPATARSDAVGFRCVISSAPVPSEKVKGGSSTNPSNR